jgi:hypothetical protein
MLPGFIATTRALTTVKGSDYCQRDRFGASVSLQPWRCPAVGPGLDHPVTRLDFVPNLLSLLRRQFSLLTSFELPTIPSLTTALPFRRDQFITLLHRRSLPRLSLGQTCSVDGIAVARQGFEFSQDSPRQAWPNRVRFRYGLVVHLRLLSTFVHTNAVTTVGCRAVTLP